ncbi:MAG: Acetolactate synthase large subunit IlvG [Alphaproteobacteria bacterium MarineAlpha2_Bin1]|nr:MAG: Acetolactate synthase large subunit IlvG [Alphaproteobacteria bacterium MarineAlpha2_Bin1]
MGKKNIVTGGSVISKVLSGYGIRTTFALAGASHTHLLDALDNDNFKIILSRHETATVAAADGYSRISGKPGVALIVSDQGIPNAVTGILSAYESCTPILILSVRKKTSALETQTLIDHDKLELVKPITKWARTVPSIDRITEYIETGYKIAFSGRQGPVLIQIPQEFLSEEVGGIQKFEIKDNLDIQKPSITNESVNKFIKMLSSAEKPIIICGTGAYLSKSSEVLSKISYDYSIPVFGNAMGRGLVSEDDKLGWSWALAQSSASLADLVILVGSRLTQRIGYGLPPKFKKDAKFIQIDIQSEELGRNRKIDLPIHSDATNALNLIYSKLYQSKFPKKIYNNWVSNSLKEKLNYIENIGKSSQIIHPYQIARNLVQLLPDDAIYIGDGADIQNWMHAYLKIGKNNTFIDHYPLGSMGIGTPLAIGVAAAEAEFSKKYSRKPRKVILVTGDGAFGFYSSEFNGASLAKLDITTIISNDGAWGTEKHGQMITISKQINTEFGEVNYAFIGKAFKCKSEQIDQPSMVNSSLKNAIEYEGPVILDIITDPEAGLLRKQDSRVQTVQFSDFESSRSLQDEE